MQIAVQLTRDPIPETIAMPAALSGHAGAWVEFRGVVRGDENGQPIGALEYEAYDDMAVKEMRKILQQLPTATGCLATIVIHRVGLIRAGETAIYVGVASRHRQAGFDLLGAFMDCLKERVPIWKCKTLAAAARPPSQNA